jgi:Kelch motif
VSEADLVHEPSNKGIANGLPVDVYRLHPPIGDHAEGLEVNRPRLQRVALDRIRCRNTGLGVCVAGTVMLLAAPALPITRTPRPTPTRVPTLTAERGRWESNSPMRMPRLQAFVAAVDDRIYAFGGWLVTTSGATRSALGEVYDPVADSWEPRAPMPQPRTAGFAVTVDDTLYAIGGGYADFSTITFVDAYDTTTDTWTAKEPRLDLTADYIVAATFLEGRIHVFVRDPREVNRVDVQAYDPESDTWSSEPSLALAPFFDVEVVDGSLRIFDPVSLRVFRYEPMSGDLTEESEMPSLRGVSFLQTASANGKVYAFVQDVDGTVLEYDPDGPSWRGPLEDAPVPVFTGGITSVTVNGATTIHAIGGYTESFNLTYRPPGSLEAPINTPTPTPSTTPTPSPTPIVSSSSDGCTVVRPHAGAAIVLLPLGAVLVLRALFRRRAPGCMARARSD